MATWALATIVLLACVGVLAYEITQRQELPTGTGDELNALPATAQQNVAPSQDVLLFFASSDAMYLTGEPRRIELTESTTENCRRAIGALIEGSTALNTPILPPQTKLRALYLLDQGELVVDFSRELELGHPKSALADGLLVNGLVSTLTQQALQRPESGTVLRVRVLLEGSPPHESFPAHVDLSEPIYPDSSWLNAPRDAQQNG
jgi:hypothetical protein